MFTSIIPKELSGYNHNADKINNFISDRHAFIDTIQVWLTSPLNANHRGVLKGICGDVQFYREVMRHSSNYIQRVVLHQPSDAALELLHELRQGAHRP